MAKKITKTISYKLKFISSAILMASSLSNLVNNLTEKIYKIKCRYERNNKKCEMFRIKYKDFEFYLEYEEVKDDLMV